MPGDVNNLGNVFGGVVLAMVDRTAGVAAMRHAGRPCVTVSIDRVDFREPIYAGELVTCEARVNYVGTTSMEVGVRVMAEDLLSGTSRHTNTCFLTFVAIDEDGRPVPVRKLRLETEEDRRRFREAQRRRDARRRLEEELGGGPSGGSAEPLDVGERAPDFALPLEPGEAPLRLSDYLGERPVVLLFFPMAFSGVCTEEMERVADAHERWTELGAAVVGVSVDSPFATRRFAEELGLPFPLVSDFNRRVVEAYGVRNDDFYGFEGVANRSAFVVDRDGRVAYAWTSEEGDVLPDLDEIGRTLEELAG